MFLAHVENKKPPRGKSKIPTWKSVFPDTAPYRYFWLLAVGFWLLAIGASTPIAPITPITPMSPIAPITPMSPITPIALANSQSLTSKFVPLHEAGTGQPRLRIYNEDSL